MKRKLLAIVLSSMMIFSLSACGVNEDKGLTSAPETETVTDTESTSKDETEESSTVEESEQKESETAEKETEESTEQTTEEKSTESSKKDTSSKSTEEKKSESTPAPHSHSYSSSVKNATCTANGTKTFVCSCGDSYTESIPATGHNWKTVSTEAKGHYEDVAVGTEEVIVGYDEKILYICKKCGYSTYSYSEFDAHAFENISHGGSIQRTEQTPIYETRTKYESQWVVDEPATSYTKCSVCGATK